MPDRRRKFRVPPCALILALILALLSAAGVLQMALADDAIDIQTELVAEVRENVGASAGREQYRFEPATLLAQGQVIYYTVRIKNPAAVFADDIVVVQRIPANTTYMPNSASGPGAVITFSIDGGQSFAAAERLTVNIEGRVQPARPEQYTHIRWQLRNPLAPGAVALARFRAVFR